MSGRSRRPGRNRVYPEVGAGGFSRVDGAIEFYGRVSSLLSPEMIVLDFGAGRGKDVTDEQVAYRRSLRNIRGRVARVIGADVDQAVLANPSIDEAILLEDGGPIPLEDGSVDLVLSDFTFEHLEHPDETVRELDRILKPGGWICARTPNKWGYIGVGARLIPNELHRQVLRVLQPTRLQGDIFPTQYRLNTRAAIREYFPAARYADYTYGYDSEPAYFGNSTLAARVAKAAFRVLPERFAALWFIFLQKRSVDLAQK